MSSQGRWLPLPALSALCCAEHVVLLAVGVGSVTAGIGGPRGRFTAPGLRFHGLRDLVDAQVAHDSHQQHVELVISRASSSRTWSVASRASASCSDDGALRSSVPGSYSTVGSGRLRRRRSSTSRACAIETPGYEARPRRR